MTDDQSPRRKPIVAQRDSDSREASRGKPGSNSAKVNSSQKSRLTVLLIIINLAAVAGLAWFSWQQSLAQTALLTRFDDLTAKIESTDESLNQSGAALSIRLADQKKELAKHWSEIRKLWGVANDRNKQAIIALQQKVSEGADRHEKLARGLAEITLQQKTITSEVREIATSSLASKARIDEIGQRADELYKSSRDMNKAIDTQQRSFEVRIKNSERAIESFDAFRRQTNQTLDILLQE
jgi:chromosome segregation ATPase